MYIICSIGPRINTIQEVIKLRNAGMTAARFNFSHSQYHKVEELIKGIKKNRLDIKIIQDLQGNKLKVSNLFVGENLVKRGERVAFCLDNKYKENIRKTNRLVVPIDYKGRFTDLLDAREIFMKDATMHFRIIKKHPEYILTEVLKGGIVRREKGLNFPGINRDRLQISKKDIKDIKWGIDRGVNIICASYVSSRKDIESIRSIIKFHTRGRRIPKPEVWAKIECQEAVNNFEEILSVSDGIMLGRGDLKAEIPIFEIPIVQERILRKMKNNRKPFIIATYVLESCKKDLIPSIGELNDIYHSIKCGVNGFMLAGEVGVAENPEYVVKLLKDIIKKYV